MESIQNTEEKCCGTSIQAWVFIKRTKWHMLRCLQKWDGHDFIHISASLYWYESRLLKGISKAVTQCMGRQRSSWPKTTRASGRNYITSQHLLSLQNHLWFKYKHMCLRPLCHFSLSFCIFFEISFLDMTWQNKYNSYSCRLFCLCVRKTHFVLGSLWSFLILSLCKLLFVALANSA